MKRLSLICFLAACAVLGDACSDGGSGNTTRAGGSGGGTGGSGNSAGTGGGSAGKSGAGGGGGRLGSRWRQRGQLGNGRQRRHVGNGRWWSWRGRRGRQGRSGGEGRRGWLRICRDERRWRRWCSGWGRRRHQSGLRHGNPVLRREGLHFLQLRSARHPGRLYRTCAKVHRQPMRWGRLQPLPAAGLPAVRRKLLLDGSHGHRLCDARLSGPAEQISRCGNHEQRPPRAIQGRGAHRELPAMNAGGIHRETCSADLSTRLTDGRPTATREEARSAAPFTTRPPKGPPTGHPPRSRWKGSTRT